MARRRVLGQSPPPPLENNITHQRIRFSPYRPCAPLRWPLGMIDLHFNTRHPACCLKVRLPDPTRPMRRQCSPHNPASGLPSLLFRLPLHFRDGGLLNPRTASLPRPAVCSHRCQPDRTFPNPAAGQQSTSRQSVLLKMPGTRLTDRLIWQQDPPSGPNWHPSCPEVATVTRTCLYVNL